VSLHCVWCAALLAALAAAPGGSSLHARPADPASYSQVATLPFVIDGQSLRTFVFDRTARRLYAGSDRGLFWSDLDEAEPRMKGPVIKRDIYKIEIAPDLGRVFYLDTDEIGYVDINALETPVHLAARDMASDLVYEPTRHELYVSSARESSLRVFDAGSGEAAPSIKLPGWSGFELEAIPGRVFLSVGGKPGLYAIDAATHAVAAWPVSGRISTPAYIEADPSGKYLFLAYYRQVVAIDVATARVAGRVVMGGTPAIAFDPGTNLLLATWADELPPIHVAAYDVTADGLTVAARLKNPPLGLVGVEPTENGFIQRGRFVLLLWKAQ